jgi:hypothetical protein
MHDERFEVTWAATMSGERLEVNVTFDSARGYVASAPELRQPISRIELGRPAPPGRDRDAA